MKNQLKMIVSALALVGCQAYGQNLVLNGSFESPPLGPTVYEYGVTGYDWDFGIGSGITALPSAWDWSGSAPPPGAQVAFLQSAAGDFSQIVDAPSAGTYALSFMDAGRPDFGPYGGDLTYQVLINGVGVDTLSTVSGQGWNTISLNVSLSNGLNTLEFQGVSANNPYHGSDDSAFIDDVSLTAVPDGGLTFALLGGALVGLQALRRKLFV
jgi:hypothetical protein